jgi:hypothetical protein
MKILKRTNGYGMLFDTENIDFLAHSNIIPDTQKSLHMHHQMTDYDFLRQFFPERHPIFMLFGESFFYVV